EGVRDGDVWGKRAKWVDASGEIEGRKLGVAIFDHPGNPRHPTWWHARDYGLFAANPFGIHDFERKPKRTGDFSVGKGTTARFHWRFLFHDGDAASAGVAAHYDEFASTPPNPVKDR